MRKKKLLFVCTANMQRSPTAEKLFANSRKYEARSAGTSMLAVKHITKEMVDWADIIFVFSEIDENHKSYILHYFPNAAKKKIIDLDVSDTYDKDDPRLVRLLREKLKEYLETA